MKSIIKIAQGTQYLSEVMDELPKNCLFDKGKVGSGGTTLALTSSENYIICVPFVSLIENKIKQTEEYPNVLGVYAGITWNHVEKYINGGDYVKRIMVTYDSLERLMQYIDPKEYNLLVDEYHLLFTQYSFRREAVQRVLPNYTQFKSYCFMTATVIEDDFLLEELKGLDIVEAQWENVATVSVNSIRCNNDVRGTVKVAIDKFLDGRAKGNAYFFVNSVDFIKEMIKGCDLTEDNCRVIYSKNNKAQLSIPRGTTSDAPKKINFVTSTAFEGCDIYDEEGKIFVVSDNKRVHTLTDISTSFQQIAGRIRNTVHCETLTHIFTETRYYNDLNYGEFKEACERQTEDALQVVDEFNALSELGRKNIMVPVESYVVKHDQVFTFDPNLVKIDLYNFKITRCLYKLRVNLTKELINQGFDVKQYSTNDKYDVVNISKLDPTFEEAVKSIQSLSPRDEEYVAALDKYPFLENAIAKIGFDGMEELGYVQTNIKRKMVTLLDSSKEVKVAKLLKLKSDYVNGNFVPAKKAKEDIKAIYEQLEIKKTANIKDFYEVKETVKKVGDKSVKGYTLIIPKVILN